MPKPACGEWQPCRRVLGREDGLPTDEVRWDSRAVGKLQRRITLGNIPHNDDARTHRHEDGDHHRNDHKEPAEHKRRPGNSQLQRNIHHHVADADSEAQRDPRDALMSVEMLSYCCTNNANRSRVSLRSIFSNCHILFGYLHSFVHVSLQ